MEGYVLAFAVLAACMLGVTYYAWRSGNKAGEVGLLSVITLLMGTGAVTGAAL